MHNILKKHFYPLLFFFLINMLSRFTNSVTALFKKYTITENRKIKAILGWLVCCGITADCLHKKPGPAGEMPFPHEIFLRIL